MKILIINTTSFAKDGITNVIMNYYHEMDKTKLHIDAVSIKKPLDEFQKAFHSNGGNIYTINREIKHPFQYINELKKIIKTNKYDIVHAHGNSSTLVLEMLAAKLAGCKIRIAHCHNTKCNSLFIHKVFNPLFKMLYTHGFACGEAAGKWLFGKDDFTVLNNAISCEKFAYQKTYREQIRKEYHIDNEEIVIGHVGYFQPVKNQTFIIDIIAELDPKYKALLIGEGPLKQNIQEKVGALGLSDRVIFVGNTNKVSEHLSACDLVVMPSLFEGLPLSLMEQQASGLQCIVSDTITKEVDKTGNFAFVSLDLGAKAWAEKINHLDLSIDRNIVSQKAMVDITASGYSIENESLKLEAFYTNLL